MKLTEDAGGRGGYPRMSPDAHFTPRDFVAIKGQLRAWKRHKMMRMLLALSFELWEKGCSVSPTKKSRFRTRESALNSRGKPEAHPTVIALAPSERTSSVRYSQ